PEADFNINPSPACVNQLVTFTNTSTNGVVIGSSGCISTSSLYWEVLPNSGWKTTSNLGSNNGYPTDLDGWSNGSNNIGISFIQAGTYIVRLYVANGCGIDVEEKTVCVQPQPSVPQFTLSSSEGCGPLAV